jgi:hypothetical protein
MRRAGREGEAKSRRGRSRPPEELKPAAAIVTAGAARAPRLDRAPGAEGKRDRERRRILEQELGAREGESPRRRRASALLQEQQNPVLIAAVRVAQAGHTEPLGRAAVEFRSNIDKASGRIRGLQATVAEHEKNIEALKKELGAVKP